MRASLSFRSFVAALLPLWLLCGLLPSSFGQFVPPQNPVIHSYSGQFVVQALARPGLTLSTPALLPANSNLVHLESTLVSVSCERIKQILTRELEITSPWRDKIYVVIHPAADADSPATVVSERFRDSWQYRLELPNQMERSRYARVVVQSLLLELANREAGARSAEIPLWLSEGFARRFLATSESEIILEPPTANSTTRGLPATFVIARNENPLAAAHNEFRQREPLTFEQLSWPTPDQLTADSGELYGRSAQLFVTKLLGLKDGRACLQSMVTDLPRYYNWQFAFLRAFQPWFSRPLDVEKWWALEILHFNGHDLAQTWPADESWHKLDQALLTPVQVRTASDELPLHSQVTLQTVIREWDRAHQSETLRNKMRELDTLRLRLAPQLGALLDEYRQAVATFLQNRDKTGFLLPFRKQAALRRATDEAIQRLDALDARRQGLRPAKPPITAQAQ